MMMCFFSAVCVLLYSGFILFQTIFLTPGIFFIMLTMI